MFAKTIADWFHRADRIELADPRDERIAELAAEALRCLRLGDAPPFEPITMRDWLG